MQCVQTPTIAPSKLASANKKSLEKSRRERKTIMRQTSTPTTNTALQQLAINTQSPSDKTIEVDSETDSNHDTALTLACAGGHEELVELLLQRNANIEHRDKKGFTPLILAATAGHEKVVTTLLNHGAELEAQSERTKDTPLSLACSGGRYEVVEILLNVGANKEHRNVSDYTPLSLAASGGYVNIIRLLLNHGAEINSRTGSKLGISPLMLAAMNGHTAAVKLLLDMGSDINAQIETNRNTALTLACFQGRHEVVSLLLDRKANVEHRAKTGLTPLMEAASGGYIEVGRVLLDKGADVNATPVPSSRDTALTIAADKGHLKFVDLLLQRGAAVEVKNKKGNSPLWLAANGGHLSVVKILKNHNADIDSQDNRRVSCLMAAFRKGHTKVVEFMVNHVTQFPSDQEMTRYIATVSDKELAEKCKECVKTIRAAKEAQAVKANKNASILLEELDMEKNREENRKAAAARRRERKKKKKMEKKEEQRKLMESQQPPETGPTSKKKSSTNSDNKDVISPEKEETDSGIDVHSQGSYSSGDNKNNSNTNKTSENNIKTNNANKSENVSASENNSSNTKKIQKANKSNSKKNKSPSRPNESDDEKEKEKEREVVKERSAKSQIDKSHANIDARNQTNNDATNNHHPKEKDGKHRNDSNDKDASSTNSTNTNNNRLKEKSYSKADNDCEKSESSEKIDNSVKCKVAHESTTVGSSHHKISRANTTQSHHNDVGNDNEITYFNSNRNKNKTTQHQYQQQHEMSMNKSSNNNSIAQKQINSAAFKREEGWKEVSRKSSTQQHTVSDVSVKKINIPTHAISRVIGRAGSNINAIRAATGAHIEVEKQGKSQNDRMITIKGSTDATKQASLLINALVKDPEVDILQMLPKLNNNARSIPPSNVIDKPLPCSQSVTNAIASNVIVVGKSAAKPTPSTATVSLSNPISKPINSSSTSIAQRTHNSGNSIVITNASISSTSTNSKSSTVVIQSRTIGNTNRSVITSNNSDIFKKCEPFVSTKVVSSVADHSGLMNLKNTIKNSTADSFGTFAAKVASDIKPATSIETNTIHLSPLKHCISNQTAFTSSANIFVNDNNSKPVKTTPTAHSYSTTIISNSDSIQSTSGRSITDRTVVSQQGGMFREQMVTLTDKPIASLESTSVLPASTLKSIDTKVPLPTNRPKTSGVQLPIVSNSQSNEYSLFDSSFVSSSQWEQKSKFNGRVGENFMENDSLPKADISKAPGYRGANLNSPVSSMNYKMSKADVKPVLNEQSSSKDIIIDQRNETQKSNDFKTSDVESLDSIQNLKCDGLLKLNSDDNNIQRQDKLIEKEVNISDLDKPSIPAHISPIGTAPVQTKLQPPIGAQLNISTSQSIKPNTSVYGGNTLSDSYPQSIIRPPSLQSDNSNLRSLSQSQLRMISTTMDPMSLDNKSNQNFYDPSYRNMNFSNVEAMQSYQSGMSNQMSMSRLNPRASAFSGIQNNNPIGKSNNNQMPMMNQPSYGRNNMFSQNPQQQQQQQPQPQPMNANYNPYQKMPFTNQTTGGNSAPFYNRAPGRSQSQPTSNNGRMFGEYTHSSHTSPNDSFNLDHANMVMSMNQSSVSPNGNTNAQNSANKNVLQNDDNRRMPRPIGTERASWKHNIGGLNSALENVDQHTLPPWLGMHLTFFIFYFFVALVCFLHSTNVHGPMLQSNKHHNNPRLRKRHI